MASNRSKRRRAWAAAQPVIDFGNLAKGPMGDIMEQMMDLLSDPSQIRQNPEYQFLQSEGMRGLSQGYGAAGKLLSGQAGRGFMQGSQNIASTFLSEILGRRGGVFSNLMQQYQTGAGASMQMSQFVGSQEDEGPGGLAGLAATGLGAYMGGGGTFGRTADAARAPQTNRSASRMYGGYGGRPGGPQPGFNPLGPFTRGQRGPW